MDKLTLERVSIQLRIYTAIHTQHQTILTLKNSNNISVLMAFSSDVLVAIAALSTVSCAGVVVSISRDSKAKKSYQLQLVQRLLFSNLILSTLFISFYAVESYLTISSLKVACYTFLPLVIIFFIAS